MSEARYDVEPGRPISWAIRRHRRRQTVRTDHKKWKSPRSQHPCCQELSRCAGFDDQADQTLWGWPQLAGDSQVGAATNCAQNRSGRTASLAGAGGCVPQLDRLDQCPMPSRGERMVARSVRQQRQPSRSQPAEIVAPGGDSRAFRGQRSAMA